MLLLCFLGLVLSATTTYVSVMPTRVRWYIVAVSNGCNNAKRRFIQDYIVVGGGASGCAFARTAADAGKNVLIIERGPVDSPTSRYASAFPGLTTKLGYYDRIQSTVRFAPAFEHPK